MSEEEDEAKKLVLSRRARFVAAAMVATAGVACASCGKSEPHVCLSPIPQPVDTSPDSAAAPSASPSTAGDRTADAGDRTADAGDRTADAATPIPVPMPCLSVVAPPPDAGAERPPGAKRDAGAAVGPGAPTRPVPCLTPVVPKPPRPPQ